MLQEGKVLAQSEIGVLQRRFGGLSVRIDDPVLDGAVEFENDSHERNVAEKARQMVSEFISRIQKNFAGRTSRGGAEQFSLGGGDIDALNKSLDELMQFLKENPTSAALTTGCLDPNSYLATHTGNVLYLCMLLGSRALSYVAAERNRQTSARQLQHRLARDLTPLGLGALAMDLGMLPLQDLFKSDKPLTGAQRQAIRKHPAAGAAMLPETFSSAARMIVRTHHENFDGSGYPDALERGKVHVFTRIVRIADAYDAATTEHVHKGAKSSARVLWEMLAGPYKRFYDPKLMAAFARLIQPFPVGAKLRLEDGRYAAIVKYNRTNPFRPTAIIAFDAHNKPIPREGLENPVDLGSNPDLRIKSFRGEDLSFIYDSASQKNAKPREKSGTLLEMAFP
jgi:HD-GYP domain-containing protein (c-di-GMP phosphodiesterase class II)